MPNGEAPRTVESRRLCNALNGIAAYFSGEAGCLTATHQGRLLQRLLSMPQMALRVRANRASYYFFFAAFAFAAGGFAAAFTGAFAGVFAAAGRVIALAALTTLITARRAS